MDVNVPSCYREKDQTDIELLEARIKAHLEQRDAILERDRRFRQQFLEDKQLSHHN